MNNIDLEEGIEQKHDYIIDWLGNKKTPTEIKEINKRREICLSITLMIFYFVISITFFVLMLIENPYKNISPLFIISATIVSIMWGIPILIVIGWILFEIIMWIISLI